MFCNGWKIIFILTALAILSTTGESHSISTENVSCEKIQNSEFPEDLFSQTQRKFGAIILHVIFAVYCFGAIAFVCSERFLPIITCICEDLKLSEDVAAATFMSLATSAPELFSNIIGTFIMRSDIGIGHVIGNGYFNMFFVAAIGGIATKQGIALEWWPLTRDCIIYAIITITLTAIVWDGIIRMHEALILLSLYIIYFIIMFNNKKIISFLNHKFFVKINNNQNEIIKCNINNSEDMRKNMKEKKDFEETLFPPLPSGSPISKADANDELWTLSKKILSKPVTFLIQYTIPDVRINKLRKFYPLAFLLCVAWIGVTTYFGTWMVSVIGDTFSIPDLVMGMIFMAAGGSAVEAYCVYWKSKRGESGIGLSNALGCNNLDVTLCLALPWFIKTLPIHMSISSTGTSYIILESSFIHVNCLLLIISVITLLAVFYLNKFKLDKKLGLISGGLYGLVLLIGVSLQS